MEMRLPSISSFLRRGSFFRTATLLILFVAFLIRIYRLDAVGLEGDEAFSMQAAYRGFSSILQTASASDPHPPLYYSFLRMWYLLAGTSEFALRFPSLAANVLTVACLLRVADLFSWRSAGLVGAALLALNPYQVWYSQEARMQTPVALFGVIAIYFALRVLREGKLLHLGLYTLFMLLSLYTHYYAIFLFMFTNFLFLVWIWCQRKARLAVSHWVGAQLAVITLFLPWLVSAQPIVSYTPFSRGSVDLIAIIKESLIRYSLGLTVPMDVGFGLSLGFLALAVVGLWFASRVGGAYPARFRFSFVSGYLFIPLGLGFLVSLLRPMFAARYLMVSGPAFYLILGLGMVALYRRHSLLGIASGFLLVSGQLFSLYNHFYDYNYIKTDFREAIAYIQKHIQPEDAIVLDGWTQTFQFWYYNTLRAKVPVSSYLFPLGEPNGWQLTPQRLDEIMAQHQGVWLLDYDALAYDPQRVVETHLATNYYHALSYRLTRNRVPYYASAPKIAAKSIPLNITCDQEALLKDFSIDTTSARPGEILHLALRWKAIKEPTRDYAVSWRLLDPEGRVVLQRDAEPASGFRPSKRWAPGEEVMDRYGMLVPTFIPPGKYSLEVVVYDKASGTVCQLRQDDKTMPGGGVLLAQIEVVDAQPVAAIEEPTPSHQARFTFSGLNLLGFDLADGDFRPGGTITIRLFWQATADISQDYEAVVRLLTDKGESLQEKRVGLGPAWFPTSRWQRGRIFATYLDVPVPARASTGTYCLSLVLKADGLSEKTFSGFPRVRVISRERNFKVPSFSYPRVANLGGLIELLGYDLPVNAVAPGDIIKLTLYWRARGEIDKSYTVFTHLLDGKSRVWGQEDDLPQDGAAPTTSWWKGEAIIDEYAIPVRSDAPPGEYRIEVGMYDASTGERLGVDEGGNRILLTTVTIKA